MDEILTLYRRENLRSYVDENNTRNVEGDVVVVESSDFSKDIPDDEEHSCPGEDSRDFPAFVMSNWWSERLSWRYINNLHALVCVPKSRD